MTVFLTMIKSLSDIKHTLYINLEHRTDRKSFVEDQLSKIGLTGTRFNAIKMQNGAVGCTMSHIECLRTAIRNDYDHILIVEDDVEFTNPELFMELTNKFLSTHDKWDVLMLGGNIYGKYEKVDDTCVKVERCSTTTAYLVKREYFQTLVDNFTEGLYKLIRQPELHGQYAIDVYWSSLQSIDNWYLIYPRTVTQKISYSDVQKRDVNYTWDMLRQV